MGRERKKRGKEEERPKGKKQEGERVWVGFEKIYILRKKESKNKSKIIFLSI